MVALVSLIACVKAPPSVSAPYRYDVTAISATLTALSAEARDDAAAADAAWTRALRTAPRDPSLRAAHYEAVAARDPVAAAADLAVLAALPLADPDTGWSVASRVPADVGARWLASAVQGGVDAARSADATERMAAGDRDAAVSLWSSWKPVTPQGSFDRGRLGAWLGQPAADDLVAGALGVPRSDDEITDVLRHVQRECRHAQARAAAARYPWTRLARQLPTLPPCPVHPQ
jgi:hypothetical protein